MGSVPLILEALVDFKREISVIAARGVDGSIHAYDPAENVHRHGILHSSTVPASISAGTALAAQVSAMMATSGDGTARSEVFDVLRRKNWPAPYDFRAIRNTLHRQLEGRVEALRADPQAARDTYDAGVIAGDFSKAHATVGEATGLIHDLPGAAELIARMDAQASQALVSGRATAQA